MRRYSLIWLVRLLLLGFIAAWPVAQAHEIRPAYLQIDEQSPQHYQLLWKIPTNYGMVQNIRPTFGPEFTLTALPGQTIVNGFVIFRYLLVGQVPLPGSSLTIEHLDQTTIETLVNMTFLDGSHYSLVLRPRDNTITIPDTTTGWHLVYAYTQLGVEHILAGWDHLAFVTALMLIVAGWRMLLKTITAFTLAHSITLGLATFGYVSLPPPPVEALIALSILLVAGEAVHLRYGKQTLASRWPWVVAFAFGLLHGFGFAGALKEIGLPQVDVPVALLFFNVGVELGQLLFISALLGLLSLVRRWVTLPKYASVLAAYGIGTLATFWLLQRIDVMFF